MERTMNKLVLSTLAVMTAVSICGVQPVDAKSVKPDPTMTMLQMPKNDEISVGNGTTKEINKQTQSLVNNVAVSTRSMIKKNWKTIYIKAVPSDNTVRFYYTDTMGQVYSGQTIKNTGLSKGKYRAEALRQAQALQDLYMYLQQTNQEIPSSIDIIVTSQGRRIRTIMNYDENIGDSSIYQQNYEQINFPNLKKFGYSESPYLGEVGALC